ncbi:unnamed protein product [Rhizophagus irregularis]|nr:unnamed protein product [Rhizophagus irregularis]
MLGNQFEISVRYIAKEFGQHYAESFNLFDLLYGVVRLAFTKERLPDESRQYYTQAYLLECHIHDLTNKIYKDNEISLESSPQLYKVETILNEYDESLEKATEDNFVDLDSILFVPSCQGDYKFRKHWLTKWFNMLSINKTCLK